MIETFLIFLIVAPIAYAMVSGGPFVATKKKVAKVMILESALKPGEIAYDIGGGNGRFIVLAKKLIGRNIYGIELAWPIWFSGVINLIIHGISPKYMRLGSFFRLNFGNIDVFFCYLLPRTMEKLRNKFETEANSGARIISYNFRIEGWEPKRIVRPEGSGTIYIYEVPKRK